MRLEFKDLYRKKKEYFSLSQVVQFLQILKGCSSNLYIFCLNDFFFVFLGVMPHCLDEGTVKKIKVEKFNGKCWEEAMKKNPHIAAITETWCDWNTITYSEKCYRTKIKHKAVLNSLLNFIIELCLYNSENYNYKFI